MPSPAIRIDVANPDPNAAPLNLTQLFQLLELNLHAEIIGDYTPYVLQNGEPGVQDQDKVWFEKDAQGRPVAIKVYWNGSWRRVYNGMLGEIRGYTGNPGTDFDSTGWGKVDGQYDGWHLCNGNDGAPDYSDHFLIGAHMNNEDHSGYVNNEWVTWINKETGMHTGGETEFTLTEDTTWRPARHEVKVDSWSANENARADDGQLWGQLGNGGLGQHPITLLGEDSGNLDPSSVNVIPPFIALGWVIFLGYRA